MTTGDFNHDEKIDVAVATPSGVDVLVNTGTGASFEHVQTIPGPPSGTAPASIATADLNHDDKLDLVTDTYVSLGAGDGHFATAIRFSLLPNVSALVSDLNHDGMPDIVAVSAIGTIDFYKGLGDGTFERLLLGASDRTTGALVQGTFTGTGVSQIVWTGTRIQFDINPSGTEYFGYLNWFSNLELP